MFKGGKTTTDGRVTKAANSSQPRGQSQSCHQCRQSIHSSKGMSEVKQGKARLKCSTCTRFWCEQCLLNRYGVVRDDTDPFSWSCPVCQKMCNCSLCRKKEGKLATGILTPLVKNSGFDSVSEFLDKGTTDIAKVLQWKSETIKEKSKKILEQSVTSTKSTKRRKRSLSKTRSAKENSKCEECDDSNSSSTKLPKRQKLTHSQYSIILEDNLENQPVVTMPSCQPNPESIHSPSISCSSPTGTTTQISCRRSARQKKRAQFFMVKDFRKKPSESSPPISCKAFDEMPSVGRNEERKLHSEEAQMLQLEVMKQKKADFEQKLKDVKNKALKEKLAQKKLILEEKAKLREAKFEQKRKAREECTRQREELRLSRIRAREKFRLAQSVKRQALKEVRQVQRQKERARKQELLVELKQRSKEEKRWKMELVATLYSGERKQAIVDLVEDSPEDCVIAGVPSLPPLPPLTLSSSPHPPFPPHLTASLLFVAEFLTMFSQPLDLKKRACVAELYSALKSGRGLSEVYFKLLKVLIEEDGQISLKLKSSKKQRDLEQVARLYLSNNIHGFVQCSGSPKSTSLEESLALLDILCHEALSSPIITDHLDSTREYVNQMKKEQRIREREAVRRVGDSLKALCNEGRSLGEIEQKRGEYAKELKLMREEFEKELAGCSSSLRNSFLGEDRFCRKYWRLQCFPGVVVESSETAHELLPWAVVDSPVLLDKILSGLHPAGLREKPLHDTLEVLKVVIFSQD